MRCPGDAKFAPELVCMLITGLAKNEHGTTAYVIDVSRFLLVFDALRGGILGTCPVHFTHLTANTLHA